MSPLTSISFQSTIGLPTHKCTFRSIWSSIRSLNAVGNSDQSGSSWNCLYTAELQHHKVKIGSVLEDCEILKMNTASKTVPNIQFQVGSDGNTDFTGILLLNIKLIPQSVCMCTSKKDTPAHMHNNRKIALTSLLTWNRTDCRWACAAKISKSE